MSFIGRGPHARVVGMRLPAALPSKRSIRFGHRLLFDRFEGGRPLELSQWVFVIGTTGSRRIVRRASWGVLGPKSSRWIS